MISGHSVPTKACVHQVMRAFVLPTLIAGAAALRAAPETPAPASTTPPTPATAAKSYASDTPWFSIIGDNGLANDLVARLALRIGRELERNGFTTADIAPDRVTVYVNSGDGGVAFNTADTRTSVRIPHGRLADERAVAEALARAALTRLAQAAGRKPAPADHAVESLAWEARISDAPGMTGYLALRAKALGPVALDALASPAGPAGDESHAVSAFWLHRTLREDRRGDPRIALAEAAVGAPLRETLARLVPDVAAGGERAEAWWPAAFYRQANARVTPVENTDESRERLREIARFVVAENGRDIPLDTAGLIARRKRPDLLDAIRSRLLELKTRLPRTNPVWQNAFIARGLFLEKLASAEPAELQKLAAAADLESAAATETTAEIARALAGAK